MVVLPVRVVVITAVAACAAAFSLGPCTAPAAEPRLRSRITSTCMVGSMNPRQGGMYGDEEEFKWLPLWGPGAPRPPESLSGRMKQRIDFLWKKDHIDEGELAGERHTLEEVLRVDFHLAKKMYAQRNRGFAKQRNLRPAIQEELSAKPQEVVCETPRPAQGLSLPINMFEWSVDDVCRLFTHLKFSTEGVVAGKVDGNTLLMFCHSESMPDGIVTATAPNGLGLTLLQWNGRLRTEVTRYFEGMDWSSMKPTDELRLPNKISSWSVDDVCRWFTHLELSTEGVVAGQVDGKTLLMLYHSESVPDDVITASGPNGLGLTLLQWNGRLRAELRNFDL